jgi:hypothetical protein
MRRFISTAYSIGSSLTIGSMKPATIIDVAWSSVRPATHQVEELLLADLRHRGLMADLGVVLLDLHVGVGVGPAVLVEDEGVAATKLLAFFRTRLHPTRPR